MKTTNTTLKLSKVTSLTFSLSLLLSFLTITSCQKEDGALPTSNTTNVSNNTSMNRISGVPTCPASIKKINASLNNGKLTADFTVNKTFNVLVKGTTDTVRISGMSGNWLSKLKYPGTEQTLYLFDSVKTAVCTCVYGSTGVLALPAAQISNFQLIPGGFGSVFIKWTSNVETRLVYFLIDRKSASSTDYEIIDAVFPQGAGTAYSLSTVYNGVVNYRIRALFDDNTQTILAEGTVTLP